MIIIILYKYSIQGISKHSYLYELYHVTDIAKKLARTVFLIRNLRHKLPQNYIRNTYFDFFKSVFRYGLFGGTILAIFLYLNLKQKLLN